MHPMMTRILFFAVLLLIIDFLAFQAVRQLLTTSGKSAKAIVYIVYWAIPLITLIYLAGFTTGWSENIWITFKMILTLQDSMLFHLNFQLVTPKPLLFQVVLNACFCISLSVHQSEPLQHYLHIFSDLFIYMEQLRIFH